MKKIYKIFVVMAMLLVVAACSKEWKESRTGLRLVADKEEEYKIVTKSATSAQTDISNFDVHIRKSTGEYDKSWKYAELPSMIELSEGNFRVSVVSPQRELVAWNQPIFAAAEDFNIIDGTVTALKLKCTVQNMKVTINLSENLINELNYYEVRVKVNDDDPQFDEQFLVWKKQEIDAGDAGFFPVKPLLVNVTGIRKLDGTQATLEFKINEVAARDHHILNIDAKVTGQTKVLELTIDDKLVDKPVDVIVPGFEDVVPGGEEKPEVPVEGIVVDWPANPEFALMEIDDKLNADLSIKTPGKLAGFVVEVSENLQAIITDIFKSTEMDFIGNPLVIDTIGQLAPDLPTGDKLKGQTEVNFPMTSLVAMLGGVGEKDDTYVFTLHITDEAGVTCDKILSFHKTVAPKQ